jgi:hypothetical protein
MTKLSKKVSDVKINGRPAKSSDPFNINPDSIFFSDLHLHDRQEFTRLDPTTGLNFRLLEGLLILEQLHQICKKHKIKRVYHLGDIFELKDKIPNHVLKEFRIRLLDLGFDVDFVLFLLGNHDYNIPTYSTLDVFKKEGKFELIDKSINLDIGYFIPFQRDWGDFKIEWKKAHEAKPKPKLICIHQEIEGAEYESGKKAVGIWDLKTDPDILYLSGHLHKPQKVHGIQFLGSPYPTKFDKYDGDYYIWLYNSKTRMLAPYQLNYSKFISLEWYGLENTSFVNLKDVVNGNYIRIVGEVSKEDCSPKDKKYLKDELEKLGTKAVIFDVKFKQEQSQSKISKELVDDDQGIIRQHAKNNVEGTNLELKRLIETGERVYESIQN